MPSIKYVFVNRLQFIRRLKNPIYNNILLFWVEKPRKSVSFIEETTWQFNYGVLEKWKESFWEVSQVRFVQAKSAKPDFFFWFFVVCMASNALQNIIKNCFRNS